MLGHPGVDENPTYPPYQGGAMEHSMGKIWELLEGPLLCPQVGDTDQLVLVRELVVVLKHVVVV